MGYIACGLRHSEGIAGVGGDLCSILGPFDEIIACGRCCRQGAYAAIIVHTATVDSSAIARIGRGSNVKALQLEVRHIGCCFCHYEGIDGVGRDLRSVLGPFDEVVARNRCCRQGASATVGVSSVTVDCTAITWVGQGVDGEALQLEVSHLGGRFFRHNEGIVGIGRNLCFVFGPFNEIVTC